MPVKSHNPRAMSKIAVSIITRASGKTSKPFAHEAIYPAHADGSLKIKAPIQKNVIPKPHLKIIKEYLHSSFQTFSSLHKKLVILTLSIFIFSMIPVLQLVFNLFSQMTNP